ncbi:unnamed protein product [Amoebophrya sp. A120]|nr:unnamed protein product [Amoebophrya sp. A120]|eukprot:GSA120T00003825001.1
MVQEAAAKQEQSTQEVEIELPTLTSGGGPAAPPAAASASGKATASNIAGAAPVAAADVAVDVADGGERDPGRTSSSNELRQTNTSKTKAKAADQDAGRRSQDVGETGQGAAGTAGDAEPSDGKAKPLTPEQVAMQTDAAKRGFIVKILILACFVDTFTMVLFMPAINILTQNAEGGPIEAYAGALSAAASAVPPNDRGAREAVWEAQGMADLGLSDEFKELFFTYDVAVFNTLPGLKALAFEKLGMPKAFDADDVPFKFSASSNFLAVVIAVTSAVGQAAWGNISDNYGRMPALHAAHLGAFAAFALMYLSGVSGGSYWGFAAGLALKGFSNSTLTVVNGYIRDIMSDEEAGPGVAGDFDGRELPRWCYRGSGLDAVCRGAGRECLA